MKLNNLKDGYFQYMSTPTTFQIINLEDVTHVSYDLRRNSIGEDQSSVYVSFKNRTNLFIGNEQVKDFVAAMSSFFTKEEPKFQCVVRTRTGHGYEREV